MKRFTGSVVEQAALGWLESLGWRVTHGLEIASGDLWGKGAARTDYDYVMLATRLRDVLARFNAVLLPKLISGELRLNGAHRNTETA